MAYSENLPHYPLPNPRRSSRMRQLIPTLVTLVVIAAATGIAFTALIWLDSSIGFLTSPEIRLAEPPPGEAGGDATIPLHKAPPKAATRGTADRSFGVREP